MRPNIFRNFAAMWSGVLINYLAFNPPSPVQVPNPSCRPEVPATLRSCLQFGRRCLPPSPLSSPLPFPSSSHAMLQRAPCTSFVPSPIQLPLASVPSIASVLSMLSPLCASLQRRVVGDHREVMRCTGFVVVGGSDVLRFCCHCSRRYFFLRFALRGLKSLTKGF